MILCGWLMRPCLHIPCSRISRYLLWRLVELLPDTSVMNTLPCLSRVLEILEMKKGKGRKQNKKTDSFYILYNFMYGNRLHCSVFMLQ